MPFDDIPEDYEPSYPCEKCDGGRVTESKEFPGTWDCDRCHWCSNPNRQFRVAELERGWDDVLLALGTIRKNALSQIDGMNSMGRAAHEERERIIAILTDPMNNILWKIPTGGQSIHADPREIRQALEPKS